LLVVRKTRNTMVCSSWSWKEVFITSFFVEVNKGGRGFG
jgi:hypothetical protein